MESTPQPSPSSDDGTLEAVAASIAIPEPVEAALEGLYSTGLNEDHLFLVGYALLERHLAYHHEVIDGLINEPGEGDQQQGQEDGGIDLGQVMAWNADRERLQMALEMLDEIASSANDAEPDGEDAETFDEGELTG